MTDWTPDNIKSGVLTRWFDASDASTITESSGSVSQWDDKSANAQHLTPPVGTGIEPTTNASTLNGLNVIDFDGVNDLLTGADPIGELDDFTIITVATTALGEGVDGGSNPSGGGWAIYFQNRTSVVFTSPSVAGLTAGPVGGTSTSDDAVRAGSAEQGGLITYWHNGGSANTTANTRSNFRDNNAGFQVGRGTQVSSYTAGYAAEILIFNRLLSDLERQIVEGYLAWKWGLEVDLATGHPYKNGAPQLWDPDNITPEFWYDFGDETTTTNSGGSITAITNRGSTASADLGLYSDSVGFDEATLNGLQAGECNTAARKILNTFGPNMQRYPASIFMVGRDDGGRALIGFGDDNSSNPFYVGSDGNGFGVYRVSSSLQCERGATISSPSVVGVRSGGEDDWELFINGTSEATDTATSISAASPVNGLCLGTAYLSSNPNRFGIRGNGLIAEVVIFESDLSTTDRQLMEGYLAHRWGLEADLPASHPYDNFYPAIEAAGAAPQTVAIGFAEETDTAQGITPNQTQVVAIGIITEADLALSITPLFDQSIALELAEETDTAIGFTEVFDQFIAINSPFEVNQGRIISVQIAQDQTVAIGMAEETDSANDVDNILASLPLVYFEYEEHLSPIKKRGKAVLSAQLAAGQTLSIERKTPITQEINFAQMEVVDPNMIEYAFDKICFIEQEIEGQFCDCRGEEWPFGNTPAENNDEPEGLDLPQCQPYACDFFSTYMTALLGAGVDLNLVANPNEDELTFPIETGKYQANSTDPSRIPLVDPNYPLGDPCVEGEWAKVFNSDTFTELLPPLALHLPNTGNLQTLRAAVIIKNNPNAGGDPVTFAPTNQVAPVGYQGTGANHRIVFSEGFGTVAPSPTQAYGWIYFTRNGTTVSVYGITNGADSPENIIGTATGGPSHNFLAGTLEIPEAAWEDWMVISVTVETVYGGVIFGATDNLICVEQRLTGKIQFAYNENAGTSEPVSITMEQQLVDSGNRYWGKYFRNTTGGLREVFGAEKFSSRDYSFMDNSDCLMAGVYTGDTHIEADLMLLAYRQNFENYEVPDECGFQGTEI